MSHGSDEAAAALLIEAPLKAGTAIATASSSAATSRTRWNLGRNRNLGRTNTNTSVKPMGRMSTSVDG